MSYIFWCSTWYPSRHVASLHSSCQTSIITMSYVFFHHWQLRCTQAFRWIHTHRNLIKETLLQEMSVLLDYSSLLSCAFCGHFLLLSHLIMSTSGQKKKEKIQNCVSFLPWDAVTVKSWRYLLLGWICAIYGKKYRVWVDYSFLYSSWLSLSNSEGTSRSESVNGSRAVPSVIVFISVFNVTVVKKAAKESPDTFMFVSWYYPVHTHLT